MEKIRIKGFDKDLKCRGFQFEIGKEYKIESTNLELCTDTVFHYYKSLKQVAEYYGVGGENRFCYIEVLGEEVRDGTKCRSNHIKIAREIVGEELDLMLGKINGNTGHWNTGDSNTGDRNTGDMNTGHWNTGDSNTGHRNTGDFNTCNDSSGFFCTQDPKAIIFNIESDMTVDEFRRSKYYASLISAPFVLVERKNDKLLTHSYKDACAKWWEKMTPINREVIKSIPNFDAEIFEEITGIKA